MDLWIRTQDRKELVKVNRLYLYAETKFTGSIYNSNTTMEYTGNYFIKSEGDCKLGFYYSKERALEVLDEIQELIKGDIVVEKLNKTNGNMNNVYPTMFYQMP